MKRLVTGLVLVAAISCNLWIWAGLHRAQPMASASGTLAGLSYSPYRADQSPIENTEPSVEQIARDLMILERLTGAVRTYSVGGTQERIPQIAAALGMTVMPGAWIDTNAENNRDQTRRLSRMAHRYSNVRRVLVGNEALLRNDVTVTELLGYIADVRRQTRKPVSTSEPWHVWLKHPELAESVDFIAVHILPYWEGVEIENAVSQVFRHLGELATAYPGKPLVLTEVGWPNVGRQIGGAVASTVNQARFVREFAARAANTGIEYFVIEAFDQPWKSRLEGQAGAYWGLFNATREPKFPWQGPVLPRVNWQMWAILAALLGAAPAAAYIRLRPTITWRGELTVSLVCQAAGTALVASILLPVERYFDTGSGVVWSILFAFQLFLFVWTMVETVECLDVLAIGGPDRAATPGGGGRSPKVSIHVAAYNEPPSMVASTLSALACLDYPDFEVIVVDNNTRDPAVWQPIRDLCADLGPRFRFFHLDPWPGFKAGALNFALSQTAADAEVVAVIDADYIVDPSWLRTLVPNFDDPGVGLVQAPQDYRDAPENLFKRCCDREYAAFFQIGMVQRARDNAIIQHGTMTMVRKTALTAVSGWGEWCITEDAELGLRLFEAGWRSVYTPRSFGKGLIPDTWDAYKRQRFRWAYGSVQILKRHLRPLLSPRSRLTAAQRYHFVAGWLPWWADAAGLLFLLVGAAWTAAATIWPYWVELPNLTFLVPTLVAVAMKFVRDTVLYRLRVGASLRDTLGAMIAGLSLSHTVAKASLIGLFSARRPFFRTPKCESAPLALRALAMVREEAAILFLLTTIIGAFAASIPHADLEARLWLLMMVLLTLPYAAAVAMALINAYQIPASRRAKPMRNAPIPHLVGGGIASEEPS